MGRKGIILMMRDKINRQNLIDKLRDDKVARKVKGIEDLFWLTASSGEVIFLPPKDNNFYSHMNKLFSYILDHLNFVKNQYSSAFECEKGIVVGHLYSLTEMLNEGKSHLKDPLIISRINKYVEYVKLITEEIGRI